MNKKLCLVKTTGRTQTRDAEQPIMGVALNQTRTASFPENWAGGRPVESRYNVSSLQDQPSWVDG